MAKFPLRTLFLLLLTITLTGAVQAHTPTASTQAWLPRVGGNQLPPGPTILVPHDTGFVNAVRVQGRFYVGYQLRPQGQVVVAEDTPTGLVPLPEPSDLLTRALAITNTIDPDPRLSLPGPKQGSLSMVEDGSSIRMYYTGRAPEDPDGPFYVWRLIYTP